MISKTQFHMGAAAGVLACLFALAACSSHTDSPVAPPGSGPTPPGPTTSRAYSVNLSTPNSDDGAISFTISGAAVDTVTSAQGMVFLSRVGTTEVRVIVAGNLAAGKVATVQFSTAVAQNAITVALEQVAARSYTERTLVGYSLSASQ